MESISDRQELIADVLPLIAQMLEVPAVGVLLWRERAPGGMTVPQLAHRYGGSALEPGRSPLSRLLARCPAVGEPVREAGVVLIALAASAEVDLLVAMEMDPTPDPEKGLLLALAAQVVGSRLARLEFETSLMRSSRATVMALASLSEHKDQDTGDHILRVACLVDEITCMLEAMGCCGDEITPEFKRDVGSASILHDVGKVAVPDAILRKPGPLDADERRVIEEHAPCGRRVLEKAGRILEGDSFLLNLASDIAGCHHERYDGTGYPEGLAGEDIPLAARIVALVDVYDALISRRPYKEGWPEEQAMAYIREQSGRQFDPKVVAAFEEVLQRRRELAVVQWVPEMSVGVEALDDDHRRLIGLINQLAISEDNGSRRAIEAVLDELVSYVNEHFAREEAHMVASGYPGLWPHKLQHATFTESLSDIRWQYRQGFRAGVGGQVLRFLRDWLCGHILVEDQRYRRHDETVS